MRQSGFINGFTAGELGPEAWERVDLVQHAKGAAALTNMLVLTTGPAVSRGGFWDRGAAKIEASAGLVVTFKRSNDDALLLEFYHLGFRAWTPLGDLVAASDTVTPWTAAQLAGLWFKQVGDVLYVTHQDGLEVQAIARLANDDWTVTPFDWRDGPWLAENTDKTLTIAADEISGSVTLTASADLFTAEHVGARFRLRAQSTGAGVDGWSAGFDVLEDYELTVSDGKIYRTTTPASGNKTGRNPPVHETGSASDGGMVWEYLHDGAGIVEITSVTSATSAEAEVITTWLPTQGVNCTPGGADGIRKRLNLSDSPDFPATPYWAEQAFSEARGWPRSLSEETEERLGFAATEYRPAMAFFTRTAGFGPAYGDFHPNQGTGRVVPDDAVRHSVGKAGAEVLWMIASTLLIVGTTDAEYVLTGGNIDDPIEPSSNRSRAVSAFGVAAIAPVLVQGPPLCVLFVTRAGDTLRELRVSADVTTEGADATILVDHIRARGFAQLAFQHPGEVCWARLSDGGLAGYTFHQQHEVRAWCSMDLPGGFTVESIATVPAPADEAGGSGDVLWALVTRTKGEAVQRRLWRLARRSEGMWLDGAEAYSGVAVSAVSGLEQYEGETVQIVGANADGAWARHPDQVVTGGAVALKSACTDVVAGLGFTVRFESLPLDLQGVSSTLHRKFRAEHVTVALSCVEAAVGDGTEQGTTQVRKRPPGELTAPLLQRLTTRVGVGSGSGETSEAAERDRRVVVENSGPFDLIVRSLRIEGDAQP